MNAKEMADETISMALKYKADLANPEGFLVMAIALKKAIEVIEFYANQKCWCDALNLDDRDIMYAGENHTCEYESGQKAREFLASLKKDEK